MTQFPLANEIRMYNPNVSFATRTFALRLGLVLELERAPEVTDSNRASGGNARKFLSNELETKPA